MARKCARTFSIVVEKGKKSILEVRHLLPDALPRSVRVSAGTRDHNGELPGAVPAIAPPAAGAVLVRGICVRRRHSTCACGHTPVLSAALPSTPP